MKLNYTQFNIFDKIIMKLLKNYSQKLYNEGVRYGYNWAKNKKCY